MNTNTMNTMNTMKVVKLALLVVTLSLFSSCSGAGNLEGTWVGKAKITVVDANTFKDLRTTESNMSFVITNEKDTSTVQIKDKETGKECTLNGRFNPSTKAIDFFGGQDSLKNCDLVIDGVPYKLEEGYSVGGSVGEEKGVLEVRKISFSEKDRKKDTYELEFEGTLTK